MFSHLLSFVTTFLKAYSQAYILITRIPEMTSFMIRTRWSVTRADLNLGGGRVEKVRRHEERGKREGKEGKRGGGGGVGGGEKWEKKEKFL